MCQAMDRIGVATRQEEEEEDCTIQEDINLFLNLRFLLIVFRIN